MAERKLFNVLFAVVVIILLSACAKKEDTVKIGVASALTGPESALGNDIYFAVKMAIEEANVKGGLPKKLELIAYDDKSDPKDAVTVAYKLASDPDVIGVVGHLVSGCAIPASKIYKENDLVMITPSATNPQLTRQGFNNVFRTCATDDVQGEAAAEFVLNKLKKKVVAVIHDRQPYGQGLAEEFKKTFEKGGGVIISFDGITSKEMDYSAVLTKIKPKKPDVIYFGGMYNEGSLICKQMSDLGIKALFMSGDGCYVPEFKMLTGTKAEGAIVSFLAPPFEMIDSAREFVVKFKKEHSEIKTYAPYAYDAANILIEAYRRAGKQDRKIVNIEVAKTEKFAGVTGPIAFKSNGDRANTKIYFYTVKKGDFVWIKE